MPQATKKSTSPSPSSEYHARSCRPEPRAFVRCGSTTAGSRISPPFREIDSCVMGVTARHGHSIATGRFAFVGLFLILVGYNSGRQTRRSADRARKINRDIFFEERTTATGCRGRRARVATAGPRSCHETFERAGARSARRPTRSAP
jgi:hypothetical protein